MTTKARVAIIALVLVILAGGTFGVVQYRANAAARKRADEIIAKASPYMTMSYESVSVNLFRSRTRLTGWTVGSSWHPSRLRIQQIEVYRFDEAHPAPDFAHIVLSGITYDPGPGQEQQSSVAALGYAGPLVGRAEIDYDYDRITRDLTLKTLMIGAADVGAFALNLHMGNIDPAPVTFEGPSSLLTMQETMHERTQQMLLYRANLSYEDDSLLWRLIKSTAERSHLTQEMASCAAATGLTGMVQTTPNFVITKEAESVLKAGANRPLKLTVSVAPPAPITLGSLMTAPRNELPALLNLQVRLTAESSKIFPGAPQISAPPQCDAVAR